MTLTVEKSPSGARRWPTAVDLYSGSGAVTVALKSRHFRVVAAIDNDPVACATYRSNHSRTRMIECNIETVDPHEIRRDDLGDEDVDLLVVCAPCQPFSSQNRKRSADARSRLILEAGRFAKVLRPKIVFFENVPGIASHGELLNNLQEALGPDYVLGKPQRLDAADYGVPQRRVRCIMFATRGGTPPTAPDPTTPENARVTVEETIGHLMRLRSGEADPHDPLHAARRHQPIALRRLAAIPRDGGSRSSLPDELALACHVDIKPCKYPDVYGRMSWKKVAPTLTTGCTDVTRGRFAHPEDDRAITSREAALLQTFPANYKFTGNGSDVATQIGNAVPVELVKALAPTLRRALMASSSSASDSR